MNQYVRTSDNVTFATITSNTHNVNQGYSFVAQGYNNNGGFAMNNSSTYWGLMWNYASNDWRLGRGSTIAQNGWNLRWDSSDNVFINANLYLNNNYGSSLVGVYSSTRYQGIFAMGDSYKLALDGSSTGTLYGLAWSHPNAGGVASNLNTHGLLVMENGTFLAAVSGSIRARDDMRAPIFYDRDNTSYYLDPNGYSRLSRVVVDQSRINGSTYPIGHYTPSETVFEIDPTWSQDQLQAYFGTSSVTWTADSTAPGGYAIRIAGSVNVGGVYSSGFPYIPVDQDDVFYMECWIKSESGSIGHYMGSIDYNQNFSSLGGNPGSFGYWVMSNTGTSTSWQRVSGYISGFGGSTGQFVSGTKYWTPQALFNYSQWSGSVCIISGWKAIKVSHAGNRTFRNSVNILGSTTSSGSINCTGGDITSGGAVYASNWFRTYGNSGWYSQTYGGGMYMEDSTWVRTYGGKQFYVSNSGTNAICAAGDIVAYYSDERLKDKTGIVTNAVDKICSLNAFYYTTNELSKSFGFERNDLQIGLSAQEVERIAPEIVTLAPFDMKTLPDGNIVSKSGENYLTVKYERLVPILVEAIKEQQKQIEELTQKITELENK